MIYLGIDHGSSTGISILKDGVFIAKENPRLTTKDNDRFVEFRINIENILTKYNPDVVCLETPSHLRNAKILRYLVGLYTIALEACVRRGIRVVEVIPTAMKKSLTGAGNADKSVVAHSLITEHGFDGKDILIPVYYKTRPSVIKDMIYDVSDATALAYYVYKYVDVLNRT